MMFEWGQRTYIMGVLNVTPDSFSGDGVQDVDTAVSQAVAFVRDGADVIDIGGESTRPQGADPVTPEIECARVLPVIEAVRRVVDVPISIDTYHAQTARAALAAGAQWVNDVWGLRHDAEMAGVVAAAQCPVVIMHNGRLRRAAEKASDYYGRFYYEDLIPDIIRELQESIDLAHKAGIAAANIILDPGIGFGKDGTQNMRIINQLHQFKQLGYPLLVGTSRKGFIGTVLGGLSPSERVEGTAATVALAIDRGADMVRVHDVKAMVRVARMTDRIVRKTDS